ncbi:splicing factor 3B subunit 2-like [Ctenocephalides felis]|uniref:splicing factor 3B subunit 2-like n=1 Tax=Ctenocephalides felis TaxID=7515 RepID=UPI000E6E157A|nr:splicing factor 3B subunit 2-like [Ctenocephalides felis]
MNELNQDVSNTIPMNMPPGTMPPMTRPPGGMPPNMPPGSMPPNMPMVGMPPSGLPPNMPPGTMIPNMPGQMSNMPPGTMASNTMPPGTMPPVSMPLNNVPPGAMPTATMPPGTMPPVSMPPGTMPPVSIAPSTMPPGTGNMPPNMSGPPPINHPVLLPPPGIPPTLAGNQNSKDLPSLLSLHVEKPDEVAKTKTEVVLPKALEQVFALKDQRAAELGTEVDIAEKVSSENVVSVDYTDADNESDEETSAPAPSVNGSKAGNRQNKHKKKKEKRKRAKNKKKMEQEQVKEKQKEEKDTNKSDTKDKKSDEPEPEIEYVQEMINITELAPMHRQFFKIFVAFKIAEKHAEALKASEQNLKLEAEKKRDMKTKDNFVDEDDMDEAPIEDKEKLSKRKLKKLTRLSVAELKQLVSRPDVVEMHDVTARDPKLLVQLKAHRNTVQVPRHWCFKRKYLQGKRGIEKPAFDLPAFIKRTGIMEMRASLQDKDESRSLKSKMRERARPKMGRIDIDYQKLHDAFFKWQTKPRMTIHGDLYYEGKEYETRLKEKKPGDLSEELKTALGMPIGPGSNKIPPPWLIAQQRYGPPPSYPSLKIPGLNAPIPDGCAFGYHTGGWGKPPVDEKGRPLYGDVFGVVQEIDENIDESTIDKTAWGEMESESEESSTEEEEEEEAPEKPDETGLITPAEGLVTPSGFSSIPAGMETPETIELRKKKIENDMDGEETPVLYQVLPERRTDRIGSAMMGSTHVYDMTGAGGAQPPSVIASKRGGIQNVSEKEGAIELALDPSELDMDNDAMAMRYEQQLKEQQSHLQKEDLSDMLAEHVAKQKTKRKRQQTQDGKQAKKYKEFKF